MSSPTDRRRWVRVLVPVSLLVLTLATVASLGLASTPRTGSQSAQPTYAGVDLVAATTVTATTLSAPTTTVLTMAQWRQRYQHVVTGLANDAVAVVKAGAGASSTDRSKVAAQAKRTLAACNAWRRDSERALGQASAIPSVAAQATWRQFVTVSGRAASDCSRALTTRSPSAAKAFRSELGMVYSAEGQLTVELNAVG
jgi:hypothetical protein